MPAGTPIGQPIPRQFADTLIAFIITDYGTRLIVYEWEDDVESHRALKSGSTYVRLRQR